jgi:hypothetical protein
MFSNFRPFISPCINLVIRPGTAGQGRVTMTARAFQKEFETDEEFFRYHLGRHGRDRSLSSLWQLFRGISSMPSLSVMDDLLQYRE